MSTKEEELPAVDPNAIDRYNDESGASALSIRSMDDIKRLSMIFIGSGMFKADRNTTEEQRLYQAGVKIIAGVEFGIQPFAAMRGINIIQGNAEMSANLMAAKVKKHPKYDYRVTKWDTDGCSIDFFEIARPGDTRDKWDKLGESSFTLEDAKTAGLAGGENWRKFARNMFFARAMSNGVRIYTPDVFYGAPVYVEGEISGEFDKSEPEAEQEALTEPDTIQVEDPSGSGQTRTTIPADEPQEAEIVESHGVDSAGPGGVMTRAKVKINAELEKQGYTAAVAKKAFILKVLQHSTIENLNEADLVMDQLENEATS